MSFIIQEQAPVTVLEIGTQTGIGAGGEITFYFGDQDILLFLGDASSDFTVNLAYDAATTLDDALNVDDVVKAKLRVTQGATPYALTNLLVDGGASITSFAFADNIFYPIQGTANTITEYNFELTKVSGNEFEVFVGLSDTYSDLLLAPDAPTAATALDFGNGSAAVISFTEPMVTALPGVEYLVLSDPSSITALGSASPIQINGLTLGETYTFEVKVNSPIPSGFSDPSNAVTITQDVPTEILVIAGGGGGGTGSSNGMGGGGAGGLLYYGAETPKTPNGAAQDLKAGTYTITVGAGGAGAVSGGFTSSLVGPTTGPFTNNTNIASTGGGLGGMFTGGNGGSGGGGGSTFGGAGTGISGQGFDGGNATGSGPGGGGGASQTGRTGTQGGTGGAGLSYDISGTGTARAGGGGSGYGGSGGTGGGGTGDRFGPGTDGTVNTGGGGGGSGTSTAGNGGKGIVILKYPDTFPAATTTGSPTIVVSGGFRRYIFNDSGTITF